MGEIYLPKHATTEEACDWLSEKLGERWTLPRLLECGLIPWFWLDFTPGWPAIFGDKVEGYLAPVLFACDTQRLAVVRQEVKVNLSRTHNGQIIKIGPPALSVPIGELRFLKSDIERLANEFLVPTAAMAVRPKQRSAVQDDAILAAIKQAGYDPVALPQQQAGKSSVKNMVRQALDGKHPFVGSTVFDKAWDRLRRNGEIVGGRSK